MITSNLWFRRDDDGIITSCVTKQVTHDIEIPRIGLNRLDTIGSRYIADQYNTILHTTQQLQKQNFRHT